jgi:hypothetical protein
MKEVSATVPADFLCFISKKLMSDPVVAEDGETYERESIENFFSEKEKLSSPITSPANGKSMGKNLMPNNILRRQINDFLAHNPTSLQGMYFRKSLYSSALKAISERDIPGLRNLIEADKRILDSHFEGNKKLLDLVCEQGTPELLSFVLEELKKAYTPTQSNTGGGGFGAHQPNPNENLFPERFSDEKKTQLLLTCSRNMKPEALSILAKALWIQDAARKTFVSQQISSDKVEFVSILLKGGVFEIEEELNEHNKMRALHLAVQGHKADMVKALIFLGADIYARNKDNQTPKRMAKHQVLQSDMLKWSLEKTLEPLKTEVKAVKEENQRLKENVKALEKQLGLFVNKTSEQSSTTPTLGQEQTKGLHQ